MMPVSRTGSYLDLLTWLLLGACWWLGGWLIATHVFRLRHRERIFAGASLGLLLFILASNFLTRWMAIELAYWGTALLILGTGVLFAVRQPPRNRWQIWRDLRLAPNLFVFIALFILFSLINFGLAILDDYSNLPLVSMIATGQVPPPFYLNPEISLNYHYGLHLFAASLVRIGGLYPWIAFDLSKALTTALSLMMAWLWFRRYINRGWGVFLGVLLVLFGSGTRWMLLFLPQQALLQMGEGLGMLGSAAHTGVNLYSALISAWRIEGGGPIPFPFAFANGMFPPMLGLGGNGSLPQMTLFTLLILARKRWLPLPGVIFGLVVASLSLVAESMFITVWIGLLIAVIIRYWQDRPERDTLQWGWVLIPSVALALMAGSAINELLRRITQPQVVDSVYVFLPPVKFYWPPAFISAHLGLLSFKDPDQILIAFIEMGPVLLLGPWVTYLVVRYLRSRKLLMAGLSLTAALSFLLPLFIRFADRERDLARLLSTSLTIWLVLGYPYVWFALAKGRPAVKVITALGVGMTLVGGFALFPPQLVAIAAPQASYYIQEPDVILAKAYWDRLEEGAQVLDLTYPYRPSALFGRTAGKAYLTIYITKPEFDKLLANPTTDKIAEYGYSYVYLDRNAWQDLAQEQRQSFQQPCVKVISEQRTPLGDFRRLLDVSACGRRATGSPGQDRMENKNTP